MSPHISFDELILPHLSALRAAKDPTVEVLIVDASSSMKRHTAAVQTALNEHVEALRKSDDAGSIWTAVVTFADAARILAPLQPVQRIVSVDYRTSFGSPIYATVDDVLGAILELDRIGVGFKGIVHVFSDGEDTAEESTNNQVQLMGTASQAQAKSIELFTNAFGISGKKLAASMGFPDDPQHAQTLAADSASLKASLRRATRFTLLTAGRQMPPAPPPISPSRLN